MKQTKRYHVFETNSSSCHSIQLKNQKLGSIKLNIDKESVIHTCFDSYEADMLLDTQAEKLSYMITHLYLDSNYNNIDDFTAHDYKYKIVKETILDYTKCVDIVISDVFEPNLNHQLYGELETIVNIWRDDDIINFIFNDDVMVKIYRD